jgi:hypothetical protein
MHELLHALVAMRQALPDVSLPPRLASCDFGWVSVQFITGANMGNKIITEADRRATPRPVSPKGVTITTVRGQKSSLERGSHTRSKKNPGKRPHSG